MKFVYFYSFSPYLRKSTEKLSKSGQLIKRNYHEIDLNYFFFTPKIMGLKILHFNQKISTKLFYIDFVKAKKKKKIPILG